MLENTHISELLQLYLEQQTRGGWLVQNMVWIIPTIISVAAAVLIIWIVNRNTSRHIDMIRESTNGQMRLINNSINEQMTEQTKFNYLPFLSVETLPGKMSDNQKLLVINGSEVDNSIGCKLELTNLGNGIASNIMFYDIRQGRFAHPTAMSGKKNTYTFIRPNFTSTFYLTVNCNDVSSGHVCEVLCLCTDIAGHAYKFLLEINKVEGGTISHPEELVIPDALTIDCTPDFVSLYHERLDEYDIDEHTILQQYMDSLIKSPVI